jgi:lincosamide nucleotidyltransferase A/C/D/E
LKAEDVLLLVDLLESADVQTWMDGGWGVDALLGYQSRDHYDLDLVADLRQVSQILHTLNKLGFTLQEDELPVRFVMSNDDMGRVDFHTVTFDEAGGGIQAQPDGGEFRYPPDGLTTGSILSKPVRCVSPRVQLLCHQGYEADEKDKHDVLLLHKKLHLELPEQCGEVR